ncbi:MAG: hypothetical protein WDZ80_00280 [Candidatus Paceibacterota bacterium]
MENENQLSLQLISDHFKKIHDSLLPNPIYGKTIFFCEGCVKPIIERNQLLGYLGAFSGTSYELNSEIDIVVIPNSSYSNLKNDKSDSVINLINEKLKNFDKEKNRYSNKIPNALIVPEHKFFQFIKDHLINNDQVKIEQFERINFSYEV